MRESGCCFANLGDWVLDGKRTGGKEGLGVELSLGLDCDLGLVVEKLDWDIWLLIIFLCGTVLTFLRGRTVGK